MNKFTREEIEAILLITPHLEHEIHDDLSFWVDIPSTASIGSYMPLMKMFADRGYHPNHNKQSHKAFSDAVMTIFFDWYLPAMPSGFYIYPYSYD